MFLVMTLLTMMIFIFANDDLIDDMMAKIPQMRPKRKLNLFRVSLSSGKAAPKE